ncbi:MAG: O-antigen ligase family protein, partial [Candidatus Helarchaeota archaeon]
NQLYLLIYVIVAFFITIYLTSKSNSSHKYITFILSYWILAHSVLSTEYFIIDIKSLPFDFQPNRILLILFAFYLGLIFIQNSKYGNKKIIILKFEKYLYLFVFFHIFVSYLQYRKLLTIRDFIVFNTSILTFVIIYLIIKRTADIEMIKVICKSFLILCSVSSIIGILQFLIDPNFFRIGSYRNAFSGFLRSNGVFHAEYIQSYYLISGIIITLFIIHKKKQKYFLVTLFFIGIVLTFHRMSWITAILLLSLYLFKFKKELIWKMVPIGVSIIGIVSLLIFMFFNEKKEVKNSPLIQQRLFSNTITLRMNIYNMVLKNIKKNWLIGFGDKKSDVYYYGMLVAGAGEKFAQGKVGDIHNGFLEILFFRGIIVFILYCMFFIFVFDYFWPFARDKNIIFYIPLFEALKFILANMTNSISLASNLGILLAIFLGISVSINKNNLDLDNAIKY